ncbi:DUF6517 family protein [Haloarcula onubensis]|uniref:DUF6517 family protein n=1 Tax=Haloarcula onubensis TaxID=2950539 RepID=A0ABU2FRM9_9EURY|nr:DUF6517 family protein [Halomicroarcula sp. S3CR25-11]MDS0282932.1 DUF6517 family protein [Halomicroarcula sp. S3CR25-11]
MRRVILTAVVALLVVSSGCVGLLTGETVEFEASEGTVSDGTLDSTGYESNNTSERTITRDVSFFGQERTIRIVNQVTRYSKRGNLANATGNETLARAIERGEVDSTTVPGLSRFVVLTSPGATVAGQSLNPAASWSNERIFEEVAGQTGQLNDLEKDGSRTTESLGESRTVTEFTATTEVEGREVDVRAHVVSFEHEGDVVVAVGVHPENVDEAENVDELLGGLEHSGD